MTRAAQAAAVKEGSEASHDDTHERTQQWIRERMERKEKKKGWYQLPLGTPESQKLDPNHMYAIEGDKSVKIPRPVSTHYRLKEDCGTDVSPPTCQHGAC